MSSGLSKSSANENTLDEFLKAEDNKIKEALKKFAEVQNSDKVTLNNIDSVFLVAANNMMVALAEFGVSDSPSKDKNEEAVLAKYIETNGTEWSEEAVKNNDKWEGHATKEKKNKGSKTSIKSFAAVATRENTIYHITVSRDFFENALQKSEPSEKWQVRVVEGTVTNGGGNGKKEIKSESSIISVSTDKSKLDQLKTDPDKPTPSDGFAFVTDDKNIIFVMKGKATKGDDKNVTAVFQLESNTAGKAIRLLHVEEIVSCFPSFFEWGKKLFMTPTLCPDKDSHNVKMFDKKATQFNDSSESIARLRDFFKDKKYFATTFINEAKKNVLLFTQKDVGSAKQKVYLWMSDGSRVSNVGTIVDNINTDETFYGSILYTNGELFVLHQTYKTKNVQPEKNIFSLTRLTDQLNNIKTTLKAWNENDEKIKVLYKEIDPRTNSWLTDGLVGFLSVTPEDNLQWKSEYLDVVVTMNEKNATNVGNGFKFSGKSAGAVWKIGEQNTNQPYNFIAFGFTLVSTVKIENNDNEEGNSLLGMVLNEEGDKRIGLWCSGGKKWVVKTEKADSLKESQKTCEQGKTYIIAFVLNKEREENKVFVYIDWEEQIDLNVETIKGSKLQNIKHFYFGAEDGTPPAKTDVTITDVLLYNKPFTGEQINQLEKIVKEKNKQNTHTTPKDEDDKLQKSAESTTDIDTPPDTPETSTIDKEDVQPSPPPPTEDSAVRVGVVGVLCFMLFGVFTLLGRYVY